MFGLFMRTLPPTPHEILAILRNVDLTTTSSKKVRTDLEQKLNCDLLARKKEIAAVIEAYVAENVKESDSESESDEEEPAPKPAPSTKAAAKREIYSDGSDADSDKPTPAKKKRGAAAKKSTSGNGETKAKSGKGNGFTRPIRLSAELSALMGEPELPRHEVVKRMWALIKGRNLYDPKNKQFAICDDDLMSVIGQKRFRTFGMLKYLKKHFEE